MYNIHNMYLFYYINNKEIVIRYFLNAKKFPTHYLF